MTATFDDLCAAMLRLPRPDQARLLAAVALQVGDSYPGIDFQEGVCGVEPRIVAEFQDAALAKVAATEGVGYTAVPLIVLADAVERFGFEVLGRTEDCRIHLYLVTPERRLEHPALVTLAREAGEALAVRRAKTGRRASGTKTRKG